MTIWQIVLLSSIVVAALKLAGYLVPASVLQRPRPARISSLLTVALLAALVAVQTIGDGQRIAIDARLPALVVAAGLFALRVPFIIVIVVAAGVAALIRALT